MKTAAAIVCVDIRRSACLARRIANLLGIVVIVSYVREGKNTEAKSKMLCQAESCHYILEVGILGIDLSSAFLIVGNLSRNTCIENERQRVDRGVRCRVECVYLVVFMKSKT